MDGLIENAQTYYGIKRRSEASCGSHVLLVCNCREI